MRKHLMRVKKLREKRARRVRKKVQGTGTIPRLSVVKSNKHIQAQLIDDDTRITLGGVATFSKEFRNTEFNVKSKAAARKIGERIAAIAGEKNIKEIVFDRGSHKYHGILAELANAVREGGLKF